MVLRQLTPLVARGQAAGVVAAAQAMPATGHPVAAELAYTAKVAMALRGLRAPLPGAAAVAPAVAMAAVAATIYCSARAAYTAAAPPTTLATQEQGLAAQFESSGPAIFANFPQHAQRTNKD